MIPKIEKSVFVPLKPDAAFRLFANDMARWWPLDSHSLSASSGAQAQTVTVEPHAGGKVIETMADGSTADWATITDWTPGARLSLDWYVGRDPSDATQVEVTFLPEAEGTRVDLVHDGFDQLGKGGAETAVGYRTGWARVLGQCYAGACALEVA